MGGRDARNGDGSWLGYARLSIRTEQLSVFVHTLVGGALDPLAIQWVSRVPLLQSEPWNSHLNCLPGIVPVLAFFFRAR